MEKTLNLILAEQKRQGDLLYQIINTVAATNVKVAEIDRRITEMDGKISEIIGRVDTMGKKLDSVYEEVKEIKGKMATKHDLEYYAREIYKLKNH